MIASADDPTTPTPVTAMATADTAELDFDDLTDIPPPLAEVPTPVPALTPAPKPRVRREKSPPVAPPAPVPSGPDAAGLALLFGAGAVGAAVGCTLLGTPAAAHWFGPPGDWLASRLLASVGFVAPALAGAVGLVAAGRLGGNSALKSARRGLAWASLLGGLTLTAELALPASGTELGGGGAFGTALRALVEPTLMAGGLHTLHALWLLGGAALVWPSTVSGVGLTLFHATAWAARVAGRVAGTTGRTIGRTGSALLAYPARVAAFWARREPDAIDPVAAGVPVPADAAVLRPVRLFDAPPVISRGTTPVPAPTPVPVGLGDDDPIPVTYHAPPPVPADAEARAEAQRPFELPALSLLDDPEPFPFAEKDGALRERASLLEQSFLDFGFTVKVVGIHTGPVITQFEVALETGLRVAKINALADDLARCLQVPSVRIVGSLPGRNTIGVELPNAHRAMVRLKELVLASQARIAKMRMPLFIGKDSEGKALVQDLAEMPHLLIAGRTGTGKSVCLNSLIISLLMTRTPDDVRLILIDPKQLEMSEYAKLPHLMMPIVTDMKKAEAVLNWAVDKMEDRYEILSRARVRNVAGYNELGHEEALKRVQPADDVERERCPARMPYVVIIIDEMGDLMMQFKKEVEGHIIRLAQKSRAAGIHLVVATQRPTVDVITGLIKSNLPARIGFQVSSRTDSMVVLDEKGAEKLLGKGDMLVLSPATSTLSRAQGTYLSDAEISRVVGSMECEPVFETELVNLRADGGAGGSFLERLRERDPLYEQAVEIVVREQRGSTSLLQRAMSIGYGKAARFVDFMAEDGILGQYNGSQAREVLYTLADWEDVKRAG